MIAPRSTRLIRTPSLEAWQQAILTCCGDPGRPVPPLVLVPTRSSARRLRATIAERLGAAASDAIDVLTRSDFYDRLFERFAQGERLSTYEREAMLEAGAHAAVTDGAIPPFHLRPSLIGEMLELYDELLRYQQTVDDFERLLVSELEPQAAADRGAERMLRQTRFLAAAFRGYASEVRRRGAFDEHELRAYLLVHGSSPWTHIVVTTADRAAEPGGLWPADFDLFARLDGIERIDVVSTEAQLEAGRHARVHDLLPGIEEVRVAPDQPRPAPVLEVPEGGERRWFVSRDREDELADAIRMIRQRRRREGPHAHRLDRTAIVFARPLPYLYPARELFASAGVPFQCDDTLPLAGEPFAAAVDLVLAFAASQASREATIALLRSPHVRLDGGMPRDEWLASVSALDTVLLESNGLGGLDRLAAIAA
ncbi:MAG TPA: hypothetical protein VNK41_12870, partial [Vicinamibacterales bacterium]|nr:hypothetical protein [Vicinamibacterales bacterium]